MIFNLPKWLREWIFSTLFLLLPFLMSSNSYALRNEIFHYSGIEFEKYLAEKLEYFKDQYSYEDSNLTKQKWMQFITGSEEDFIAIDSLLNYHGIEDRLLKIMTYLQYGGQTFALYGDSTNILISHNSYFEQFSCYLFNINEICTPEVLAIIHLFIEEPYIPKLPWTLSENEKKFFIAKQDKWKDHYLLDFLIHLLELNDILAYKSVLRFLIEKNRPFFYWSKNNKEFAPLLKKIVKLIVTKGLNTKQKEDIKKYYELTLNKIGESLLKHYAKDPYYFDADQFWFIFLQELNHCKKCKYPWDELKSCQHLFLSPTHEKKNFFRWTITYLDWITLKFIDSLIGPHKFPQYEHNRNILHLLLLDNWNREITLFLTNEEVDNRLNVMARIFLLSENYTEEEKIHALIQKDEITGQTPVQLVNKEIYPETYRTFKHYQSMYQAFNFGQVSDEYIDEM